MKRGYSKYSITGLFVLLALASCNDDESRNATTPPPAVQQPDTVSFQRDNEIYASWEEFYRKEDLSFSLDSFLRADTITGELHISAYRPSDSFYNSFGNLLVYNADSTMFIDAYSSNWIVEKGNDGKMHAREAEIDQEVTVVNKKTNVRSRLFFCGPGCQVQKVFWYNEHIVGIMGLMAEYSDEYYTPTIWYVNIENGITIPYQSNASVSIIQANDYVKNYMGSKGVTVE